MDATRRKRDHLHDLAHLLAGCGRVIEDLWLNDTGLTDDSIDVLCAASLPRLRGIWLHGNQLTDQGVAKLRSSDFFDQLDGLSLFQNALGGSSEALLAGHALAAALHQTARRPGVLALRFAGGAGDTGGAR
jgi:hypothetical protein